MSALVHVEEIITSISDEIDDLDAMLLCDSTFFEDPESDFAVMVRNVQDIREDITKSRTLFQKINGNPEHSKYVATKFQDNGDLLKRLQRLTSAVDELEYKLSVGELDFRTLDNILDIIDNEILETPSFHGIQEFCEVNKRINEAKSTLKREIFKRYREIGVWSDIPISTLSRQIDASSRAFVVIESLRSANMVVDTLGEDAVTDLLEMIIQMQVLPYQVRAGVPGGELFGLQKEKLDKRWELLYSILGASSAPHMQRVMSPEWAVTFKLYVQFCRRTAIHLETLLDLEVDKLYQRGRSFLVREPSPATSEGGGEDSQHLRKITQEKVTLDPSLVQEHGNFVVQTLKSVLAVEQEVHKMFDDGVFALSTAGYVSAADSDTPAAYTCFAMSKVFDKYLDPFVQGERHNVQELIQSLVAEDVKRAFPEPEPIPEAPVSQGRGGRRASTQPPAEPKRVFVDDSSVDMIAYTSECQSVFNSAEVLFQTIRSSLLRCASFSTGKPLLSLSMEYKVCIQIYAENIRSCLLPTIPPTAKRVGRRTAYTLTLAEEVLVCRAITTAERCITLIPQMQNEIGVKIRSDYAADVDMRFQIELLMDVTSYALDILVGSLLGRINDSLVHMANASWADMSHVGDSSPYVRMINTTLSGVIPRMRKVLSPKCFDLFCSRLSSDFLDHFLALIMGLRRVSVVGAEQLLLDITDLKPVLLKLHLTSLPAKSFERQSMVVGQSYVETVTKKCQLIELVLKLICTDDEQFEETFYIMWPEGQEADMTAIRNLRASGSASSGSGGAPAIERKSSNESLSDLSPSRLGNAVESLKNKANVLSKFKIPGRKNKGAHDGHEPS